MIMSCKKCNSNRVASVSAKCSDCCGVNLGDVSYEGYVPEGLGIGGGDYIDLSFCLDCGQLQGNFPLPTAKIEENISDEQVVEFFNNHFDEGSSIYFNNRMFVERVRVANSAEEESFLLGAFVRDYFEFNSDRTPSRKHPSAERFLQMFRDRDADLSI